MIRTALRTARCPKPRKKEDPLYARLYAESGDERDLYDFAHRWGKDGKCLQCGWHRKHAKVRVFVDENGLEIPLVSVEAPAPPPVAWPFPVSSRGWHLPGA